MPTDPAPRRRIVARIEVGADSWEELENAIADIERRVFERRVRGAKEIQTTMAGGPWSGRIEADEDETITADSYALSRDEWLERRREASYYRGRKRDNPHELRRPYIYDDVRRFREIRRKEGSQTRRVAS